MAQVMQDRYILGQSSDNELENSGDELRIDLRLKANINNLNNGRISGVVTDSSGNPIANAFVKLMDTNYNPIMHSSTDENGKYFLGNVPRGAYNIFAIASGMNLNQQNPFSIIELQNIEINFTLQPDPAMKLGIIAGDLNNSATDDPISGAVVSLYSIDINNTETLEYITYSNEYGQFVFREINNGNYVIKISALGYTDIDYNTSVTESGQIVPINISMTANENSSRGTISGIITDENNQVISSADVILYKVNSDKSLTPVAFTKTNSNGVYLFINVDSGHYKIKSSQIEYVTIV